MLRWPAIHPLSAGRTEGQCHRWWRRFATEAVRMAEKTGRDANSVIREKLAHLEEMVGGYDFATVISRYWEGYDAGNEDLKSAALRWLRGEYSTRTEARRDLGVRTIIGRCQRVRPIETDGRFRQGGGLSGGCGIARRDGQPVQACLLPGAAVQLRAASPHPERRAPGHRTAYRVF